MHVLSRHGGRFSIAEWEELRIADFLRRREDENTEEGFSFCDVVGPAEKRASVSSFLPVESLQFQAKVLLSRFGESLQFQAKVLLSRFGESLQLLAFLQIPRRYTKSALFFVSVPPTSNPQSAIRIPKFLNTILLVRGILACFLAGRR